MPDNSQICEHNFHNPQQNFPGRDRKRKPEAKFAEQFVRVYYDKFLKIHSRTRKNRTLFIREMPVSGNGIADLFVLSWSHSLAVQESESLDLEQLNPTLRAFEFKMSDWRSGLMQAHRYKYFSHASILVVPKRRLKSIEPKLAMFQTLRVGLWGFSPETGSITRVYTPRPKQQQIAKYGQKAIQLAKQAVCS